MYCDLCGKQDASVENNWCPCGNKACDDCFDFDAAECTGCINVDIEREATERQQPEDDAEGIQ